MIPARSQAGRFPFAEFDGHRGEGVLTATEQVSWPHGASGSEAAITKVKAAV